MALPNRPKRTSQEGQSLLEVIVATGAIIVAMVVLLGSLALSLRTRQHSEQELVVTQLAREGVEVVRGIRDSNWINARPWSTGLLSGQNSYTATPIFDPLSGWWRLAFDDSSGTKDRQVYLLPYPHPSGQWYSVYVQKDQTGSLESCLQSGSFCRYITLTPLAPINNQSDGVNVVSTVTWRQGGQVKQLQLQAYLFDWK